MKMLFFSSVVSTIEKLEVRINKNQPIKMYSQKSALQNDSTRLS